MRGLLSFLLFGAFFYLMMRFGCGAHMVHGHDGSGGRRMSEANAKDPVCGMDVDAGKGYAKMHEGREYRFCSRQCLDKFDAEPHHYVLGKGAHE